MTSSSRSANLSQSANPSRIEPIEGETSSVVDQAGHTAEDLNPSLQAAAGVPGGWEGEVGDYFLAASAAARSWALASSFLTIFLVMRAFFRIFSPA